MVRFSGPGVSPPAELGRRTLTVSDSSSITEMILPIVVNGAVAEKLHYQTIFTVLHTTASDVKGTLQVFSNAGAASGAFCSPLAPAWRIVLVVLVALYVSSFLEFSSCEIGGACLRPG